MIELDPSGTLLKTAALAVLTGIAAGLLSGLALRGIVRGVLRDGKYAGVWAEWRRRPALCAGAFLLAGGAAWIGTEEVWRRLALRDLYWLGRPDEILLIARLGSGCGLLLVALLASVAPLLAARRRARD